MYNNYFELDKSPFLLAPNPDFFCELPSHKDAIQLILYCIKKGECFFKLVGEVGVGKTLVCKKIISLLADKHCMCFLPNPDLTPDSFRGALAMELGVDLNVQNQHALIAEIKIKLLEHYNNGRKVVVIVDEAQAMRDDTLESLRLLTNIESESERLLQVLLVGQPELDIRLSKPHLRQLLQRITNSYYLKPISKCEVDLYLASRLILAGHSHGSLFTDKAKSLILQKTKGIPRMVNILCDKSLLVAFNNSFNRVSKEHVLEAVKDSKDLFRSLNHDFNVNKSFLVKLECFLVFIIVLFVLYLSM